MLEEERLNQIRNEKERWERENQAAFKDRQEFTTTDGIPIKRLYTPLDLKEKNFDYVSDVGFPGEYPFVRGIEPNMYRSTPYEIGQYAGHASPEESNRLHKLLIARGNKEPHIAFDMPTMNGYCSDNPLTWGDVGKCGVAIDSLEDMETLFDGIDLSDAEATLVNSHPLAITLFAMHVAAGEKQGHVQADLRGVIQNDALSGYASWGTYAFPPECGLRLATDVACYCALNMPKYYPFNIVYHQWPEVGLNRIQSLGAMLACGKEYIRAALKRGVDIDAIGPKIAWLGTQYHRDWFAEIAKVRAWRRLWARIMKEEFGAKNPQSCMVRIHNAYGCLDMTGDILEMNIVRHGLATLGAAIAGIQSLGGGGTYDEPLGIPSAKAITTAILDQHLIIDETGVGDTIDPLAGSYYVEYLTSEIEERVLEYIKEIEDRGGIVEVIKSGWIFKEIAKSALERQTKVESGELKQIGINEFVPETPTESHSDYYKPNPEVIKNQTAKLKALRERRDNNRVRTALDRIRAVAEKEASNENSLVPPVMEAVKAYATIEEVRTALEDVFGKYTVPSGV